MNFVKVPLDKLPKSIQPRAKDKLHQIWMSQTKEGAEKAFDHFIESYEAKYPKAAECLAKDRDALLTFYDFPAEHWTHLRTTNPIESMFATVRLRTSLQVAPIKVSWLMLETPLEGDLLVNGVIPFMVTYLD